MDYEKIRKDLNYLTQQMSETYKDGIEEMTKNPSIEDIIEILPEDQKEVFPLMVEYYQLRKLGFRHYVAMQSLELKHKGYLEIYKEVQNGTER